MKRTKTITLATLTASLLAGGISLAPAQQLSIPERVASLKASLAASQMSLKQYEWIETTVVSLKGDEKSRKQERCYYGADGRLTKIPVDSTPPPAKKRGLRGIIAEHKTEELTDYMKQAIALLKSYVPPNPAMIQAAKDAGKISIQILDPGKRARLNFADYYLSGDSFGVEVDLVGNTLLGLTVKTYLEDAKDTVGLDSRYATLADGTSHVDTITLNAQAKEVKVVVTNSGYRKTTN